jgi:hypothetical protein
MAVKDRSQLLTDNASVFGNGKNTRGDDEKTFNDNQLDSVVMKSGDNMSGPLLNAQGANIASGTTVNLANATGNSLTITGTTTITGFGTVQAGAIFNLTFSGILILTHNATSLILPTAANITTAAGDVMQLQSLGSGNWKCIGYLKANGGSLINYQTVSNLTTNIDNTDAASYPNTPTVKTAIFGNRKVFKCNIDVSGNITILQNTFSGTPAIDFLLLSGTCDLDFAGPLGASTFNGTNVQFDSSAFDSESFTGGGGDPYTIVLLNTTTFRIVLSPSSGVNSVFVFSIEYFS